ARPRNFLCTSAISGLTSDRFCFSDLTSPSSTSRVSAPTYTPGPFVGGMRRQPMASAGPDIPGRHGRPLPSGARLLPHLEGLDHVADLDVVVADADAALEALTDLGGVVLEPAQRLDREAVGHHDAVPDQACLRVPG